MKFPKKKALSWLLTMVMLFSMMSTGAISVSAATLTQNQFEQKLGSAKSQYPHGTQKYEWAINGTVVGWQCHGYVRWLSWYVWGVDFANGKGNGWSLYKSSSTSTYIDKLVPGDVVRYRTSVSKSYNHSIFITSISGNTIYYTDCNSDGKNTIKWNQSVSKSVLAGYLKISLWGEEAAAYGYIAHYNPNTFGTSHTHSYTLTGFEAAHPHKEYKKCSCGKIGDYTGKTRAYQNCSTCMKLSAAYVQPVKAYTINTGKTTVYSSVNGSSKSNKIYDTDLCTISQIYDCGWCKVTFPLDSGGTDTGYVKISVFMKGGGFITYTSKQVTTYSRSNLKTSIGYAGAGDKIYVLGNTTSAVQIAYPLTAGGYKVGWVPISAIKCTATYNANGGSGSMSNTTVQYQSTFTLSANKFTKTGYTFSGWNVCRNSDKKWYVSGQGWKTASEISSKGYTKALYKNQWRGTLEKTWLSLGKTNDTYTFYAVWKANTLSVYYNANGGTISSDTYKLSSNVVYNKSDGSKYTQKWTYNAAKTNGLVNASTFGLSREGYTFSGWGTSASGGTIFDQNDTALIPTKINANIKNGNCSTTLYAVWTPKKYTVQYNANGGTGAPAAQTKAHGTALALSKTTPTRSGHTFKGWATSSTAKEAAYQPGSSYTANKSVTLYAVWQSNSTTHTHEWETAYTVDKKPTCTENGLQSIHCKGCTQTMNAVSIPATGHILTEVVTKEADCTSAGEIVMRCSACGADLTKTEVPAWGHRFVSTVTAAATCTQTGLQEDICAECGIHAHAVAIPALDHIFGEWEVVREATADSDGLESRQCIHCGEIETRTTDYIPGDVDGDENISVMDALMTLQAASGKITLDNAQKNAADVNQDGRVQAVDALLILQFATHRITAF